MFLTPLVIWKIIPHSNYNPLIRLYLGSDCNCYRSKLWLIGATEQRKHQRERKTFVFLDPSFSLSAIFHFDINRWHWMRKCFRRQKNKHFRATCGEGRGADSAVLAARGCSGGISQNVLGIYSDPEAVWPDILCKKSLKMAKKSTKECMFSSTNSTLSSHPILAKSKATVTLKATLFGSYCKIEVILKIHLLSNRPQKCPNLACV